MVFRVTFRTAQTHHAADTLQDLEELWTHVLQRMPNRMRSSNVEMLRKLMFATALRAHAFTASSCSSIQVVVELSS
jgi:hypothetical protein